MHRMAGGPGSSALKKKESRDLTQATVDLVKFTLIAQAEAAAVRIAVNSSAPTSYENGIPQS